MDDDPFPELPGPEQATNNPEKWFSRTGHKQPWESQKSVSSLKVGRSIRPLLRCVMRWLGGESQSALARHCYWRKIATEGRLRCADFGSWLHGL